MTDEELIARLRDFATREASAMPPGWPDAHGLYSDAADRIEALVKERDILVDRHERNLIVGAETRARAERLEAAASSVVDDVCSYICPSVGRAGEPILHDPRCIALRAALTGADHE